MPPPESDQSRRDREERRKRVFPGSLCHDCGAPPKWITNSRGSTFLYCPIFRRYPPQPVLACREFVPLPPEVASGS